MVNEIKELLDSENPDDKKLGFFLLGKLSWEEARQICYIRMDSIFMSYQYYYLWRNNGDAEDELIYKFKDFFGVIGSAGIGISKEFKTSDSYPGPQIDMT